jgi:hypothetical protein
MQRRDISDIHVCLAYIESERLDRKTLPEEILCQWFPLAPFKVVWAAMERASERGLIDYGVNLRWGWLTERGLAIVYGENWRSKVPQVPIPNGTSIPRRSANA